MDQIEMFDSGTFSPEDVKKELYKLNHVDRYPFSLIFDKARNDKTLGIYSRGKSLITLYNDLLPTNQDLMETAIHELAHHIDYVKNGYRKKPHTGSFNDILSSLRIDAKRKGILNENINGLDEVYKKAVEFGKAIKDFVDSGELADPTIAMIDKLYGVKKSALLHFAKIYNTHKKEHENDH